MEGAERRMLEEVLMAGQQARLKELQGAPFAFPPSDRPTMSIGRISGQSGGDRSGGRVR